MGQERQSAKVRGKVAMINEAMLETLDGRYELATEIRLEMPLHVSDVTVGLIRAGVSQEHVERHIATHQRQLESWLVERVLDDGLLSEYITELHQLGKSPATISQAVAAVKLTAGLE